MARILVLDDVKEAVDAVCKILEKSGHEVVGYTDEDEAINHVTNHPVDLAVLDIKLKKIDGVEVLGRLKEIRPSISGNGKGSSGKGSRSFSRLWERNWRSAGRRQLAAGRRTTKN